MIHTIDAKQKKLGRIASQAASILMGKHSADFARNTVHEDEVLIINASKADISEDKLKTKEYVHYSGFPGGLKNRTGKKVVEKAGYAELFRLAIYGMLPSNKLRSLMIKKLKITE
jgi:large subunit ribosomal protein L13